jgi:hypothetical protein
MGKELARGTIEVLLVLVRVRLGRERSPSHRGEASTGVGDVCVASLAIMSRAHEESLACEANG